MKTKLKELIISILIPLFTGGLSAIISMNGMLVFNEVMKPALTPPNIVFPIAWTILYTLMGIASFLVFKSNAHKGKIDNALILYGIQLLINFLWSIFFFNFKWYLFSFIWLILLWITILITIIKFYKISKAAAYLLIPYIIWVTFAGYLTLGVYLLN